jgi:hypothetical protein
MEECSKGKRIVAANCEGGQAPAWAVVLQMMMMMTTIHKQNRNSAAVY